MFLEEATSALNHDPLIWRKINDARFPKLSKEGRRFFGNPHSFVESKGSSADETIISAKNAENGETFMLLNLFVS